MSRRQLQRGNVNELRAEGADRASRTVRAARRWQATRPWSPRQSTVWTPLHRAAREDRQASGVRRLRNRTCSASRSAARRPSSDASGTPGPAQVRDSSPRRPPRRPSPARTVRAPARPQSPRPGTRARPQRRAAIAIASQRRPFAPYEDRHHFTSDVSRGEQRPTQTRHWANDRRLRLARPLGTRQNPVPREFPLPPRDSSVVTFMSVPRCALGTDRRQRP